MPDILRYDIINHLIKKHNLKSYLEVGIANNECFNKIEAEEKHSVDIAGSPTFLMTSDEFFRQNEKVYDIIFVDGDHSDKQAERDISNAIMYTSDTGFVVCHDCNPLCAEWSDDFPERPGFGWNGGVWKTIARMRHYGQYEVYTLDTDNGVAIVEKSNPKHVWDVIARLPDKLDYAFLDADRVELLGLTNAEEWMNSEGR